MMFLNTVRVCPEGLNSWIFFNLYSEFTEGKRADRTEVEIAIFTSLNDLHGQVRHYYWRNDLSIRHHLVVLSSFSEFCSFRYTNASRDGTYLFTYGFFSYFLSMARPMNLRWSRIMRMKALVIWKFLLDAFLDCGVRSHWWTRLALTTVQSEYLTSNRVTKPTSHDEIVFDGLCNYEGKFAFSSLINLFGFLLQSRHHFVLHVNSIYVFNKLVYWVCVTHFATLDLVVIG